MTALCSFLGLSVVPVAVAISGCTLPLPAPDSERAVGDACAALAGFKPSIATENRLLVLVDRLPRPPFKGRFALRP